MDCSERNRQPSVDNRRVTCGRSHPHVSVLIPTRGRPNALSACLRDLATQDSDPASFEVIVVFDGPDDSGARAAQRCSPAPPNLKVIEAPRIGNAHAKNVAIEAAEGEIVLFLNDDVAPEPGLLSAHARAHAELGGSRPSLVVGYSPFAQAPDESVLDLLVRRTSMVFFYDQMVGADGRSTRSPEHDWGYRHAWSLNLSAPRALARDVGGFRPAIANCCYEDIEFAWRARVDAGAPVLFRPEAKAVHHHRMTPEDYLRREWRLGYSAASFCIAAPDCAMDVFGRDLLAPDELTYARAFIERESRSEKPVFEAFSRLSTVPAGSLDGGWTGALLAALHGQQLLLKRLAFRRGLLAAVAGERYPGLFLPCDGLATEPALAPASVV